MSQVRLFFDDFSPDQSAAMCFSIACGLPRDVGQGVAGAATGPTTTAPSSRSGGAVLPPPPAAHAVPNQTVRTRALDAALMNCKPPGFSSPGQSAAAAAAGAGSGSGGGIGGGGMAVGGGVIMGEKFTNSALHNGLQLFIGRLLRPFWFLPVVIAPPASSSSSGSKRSADGKAKGGGSSSSAPPPIVRGLEALRAPLDSLKASIRIAFPRSVGEDLAALASKEDAAAAAAAAAAQTGTAIGSGGMVRRARTLAVVSGGGQQQQQQPETPQQRHQKALKREALEVHEAYRLVSRAAEAVQMAGVLARAAKEFPDSAAKVSWSSIDGIELWRLVSGADEHRKVSCLLADLVGPKGGLPADARNRYARELGSACRGFFGSGDRRTFEGVELLRRVGALAAGNKKRLTAAEEASARQGEALLAEAAKEWRGERAVGPDGQLARACAALAELGRLEAVVDVCMTCANNFDGGGGVSSRPTSGGRHGNGVGAGGGALALMGDGRGVAGGANSGSGGRDGVLAWEEGVYQGGGVIGAEKREKTRLECYQRVLTTVVGLLKQEQLQPPSAGSGGTDLAKEERRPSKKVESLIARCLSYRAPVLDEMLFGVLEVRCVIFFPAFFVLTALYTPTKNYFFASEDYTAVARRVDGTALPWYCCTAPVSVLVPAFFLFFLQNAVGSLQHEWLLPCPPQLVRSSLLHVCLTASRNEESALSLIFVQLAVPPPPTLLPSRAVTGPALSLLAHVTFTAAQDAQSGL